MLLLISLVSCGTYRERFDRIDRIAKEVDYGTIVFNDAVWCRDDQCVAYATAAAQLLGVPTRKLSYPYRVEYTDDFVYYLIEYDNGRGIWGNFNALMDSNKYRFDIGLFRMNLDSGVTEWISDFQDVFPWSRFNYSMPNVYSNVFDDIRLLFFHNGMLELYDVENKTVLDSIVLHEPDLYKDAEHFPYRLNAASDYYAFQGDTLDYYEMEESTISHHVFPAEGAIYADRYANVLILSTFTNAPEYIRAYDLDNGEAIPLEEGMSVMDMIQALQEEEQSRDDTLILHGKEVEIWEDGETLTVVDKETQASVVLSEDDMLETSQAYRDLTEVWSTNDATTLTLQGYLIAEERLFVLFTPSDYLGDHPLFLFEFDTVTHQTYYVGYYMGYWAKKLIIVRE